MTEGLNYQLSTFASWGMGVMTGERTAAVGKPKADSCPARGWGGVGSS